MSLHMKIWREEGQLQDIFKNSEYFEKYNYKYSSIRIIFFSYLGYSPPEPCARLRPCIYIYLFFQLFLFIFYLYFLLLDINQMHVKEPIQPNSLNY
jgi:hypothetical protein